MLEKKVVKFSCFFLVFPQVAQWRETFSWRCLVKNVLLNIFQNSHENTYARISFLIKLQTCKCFPVNFAKFLRTSFFIEHLWWLFLQCAGHCFVQSWPKQTKTKLCRLFSFKIIVARSGPILHK